MPRVTLRLPAEGQLDALGFAYSPALEAILSLRPVLEPKQYPLHLPWVRRCRELSDELREEIERLSFCFRTFIPGLFEVGLRGDFPTIDDELERIVSFDDDRGLYELTLHFQGPTGPRLPPTIVREPDFQQRILDLARSRDPDAVAILARAFEEPRSIRQRLADLLSRYWQEAFRTEWTRIQPRLDAQITAGARLLVTVGIERAVAELFPEARYDPSIPAIVLERRFAREVDVAARGGLAFVPTFYGSKVMVEADDPWPVAIIHPLPQLQQPEIPRTTDREVAEGLRALGDETRLQIARLVAEQPRSTKELAEILSLSESAVSRHLKILAGAGIVDGHRDGYFVLYRLQEERIGQLGGALRTALGLLTTDPGSNRTFEVVGPRPLTVANAAQLP